MMKVSHAPSASRVARLLVELPDGKPAVMPNKRMASLLGITERSVRRAVNALAEVGALDIVQDEKMDRDGGYRRLVPHTGKLREILAGKLVPAPQAPTV